MDLPERPAGWRFLTALLLSLIVLLGGRAMAAADAATGDMPNPFLPVPIHKEGITATWRHPMHRIRQKWDDYFRVFPKEMAGAENTTLERIKADPSFYLDRKVTCDIIYGKQGSFYRPFTSPFHQDVYINFSGWAYGAEIWVKDTRVAVHPLFYVDKERKDLIARLQALPAYTPLHVWATVRSRSENMPWIEIAAAEIIPEAALTDSVLRHLELGHNQFARKRYDLAIRAYEGALALQLPVNVEARIYSALGKSYFEQRAYIQARDALVNAVLRDERDLQSLILLARADLRLDRAEEARQAAERAIVIEPGEPAAHAELGLALALLGDTRGGLKELDVAQKLGRHLVPEASRNRAVIFVRDGELESAREELKQAIIARPTDVEFKIELGDVHVALNQFDLARTEYTQARDLAPTRPEPFYKLAFMLKKQADALKTDKPEDAKKLYEEALDNVKQALGKDDQYTPAYGLQAELLRALGKTEDAKKVLDNGVRIKTRDVRYVLALHEHAAALGDWDAMEVTSKALATLRPTAVNHSRVANVLANRPEPDAAAAAAACEAAVKAAPDAAADWALLGHLRVRSLQDFAGAETALQQAVKLDPKNAAAWTELAIAQHNLGKPADAIAAADEAGKLAEGAEALTVGAQARLDRGSPDDLATAAELAQRALGLAAATATQKAHAQSVLADALARSGKVTEALEGFAKADEAMKDDSQHQLAYGCALLKDGKLDEARQHLDAAATLSQAQAATSVRARGINAEAAEALQSLKRLAKAEAKGKAKAAEEANKPAEKPDATKEGVPQPTAKEGVPQPTTAKKSAAPVIEGPENGQPGPSSNPR
jgi:tetratricopeptide (TPR) repeat protein